MGKQVTSITWKLPVKGKKGKTNDLTLKTVTTKTLKGKLKAAWSEVTDAFGAVSAAKEKAYLVLCRALSLFAANGVMLEGKTIAAELGISTAYVSRVMRIIKVQIATNPKAELSEIHENLVAESEKTDNFTAYLEKHEKQARKLGIVKSVNKNPTRTKGKTNQKVAATENDSDLTDRFQAICRAIIDGWKHLSVNERILIRVALGQTLNYAVDHALQDLSAADRAEMTKAFAKK